MKLIGGVVLLLIRVALGVLMVTAGAAKLGDPQTFALAIKAYDLGIPEPGLIALAYLIPWTEIL
ncbi:MAG: MauE/DoxX family redox-associated membrane protein, partial [Planctomycetota bacterium]